MRKDNQSTRKQDILENNNRLSGNFLGSFCTGFNYKPDSCFEKDELKSAFQDAQINIEKDELKSAFQDAQINIEKHRSKTNIRNKILKCITDTYLLLMLLVYPLIVGPQGYINITKVKFKFFFLVTLAYVALMLVMMIFLMCKGKLKSETKLKYEPKCEPKYQLKGNTKKLDLTQVLAVAFLIFTTFFAILSPYSFWNAFGFGKNQGLLNIWLYGSSFLLICRYGRTALWQIYALSMAALINCGVFFLQYIGLNPFWLYPEGYGYKDGFVEFAGNFAGLMGNADIFAGFLGISISLMIGLLLLKSIYSLIIKLIISVLALVLLQISSGLLAALAVNVLVLVVLLAFFFIGQQKKRNVFIITIVLLTATFLTVGFASSLGMFSDSLEDFKHEPQLSPAMSSGSQVAFKLNSPGDSKVVSKLNSPGDSKVVSKLNSPGDSKVVSKLNSPGDSKVVSKLNSNKISSGRIYIWENTIKTLKTSSPKDLLLGTGSNTFQQRTKLRFERYDDNYDKQIVSIVTSAHNLYLDILMNYGLIGLLLYLALFSIILHSSQLFLLKLNGIPLVFPKKKQSIKTFLFGSSQEELSFESMSRGLSFAWKLVVISYSIFAFFSISTFIVMPYFIIAAGLSISTMKN